MGTFHNDMRALAVDLVNEFGSGGTASFTRAGSTVFDPITGNETITDSAAHTSPVVVLPDTDQSREEARVLGWDVRFACPVFADGFVPAAGDYVTLPGRSGDYVVIAPVEAPAPDGEYIMFTIRARRGI